MKNKQFEGWLTSYELENAYINSICATGFDKLPFSMQWGVYLEFFDSVGIHIDQQVGGPLNDWFCHVNGEYNDSHASRHESQQEAIKKAFKILEE